MRKLHFFVAALMLAGSFVGIRASQGKLPWQSSKQHIKVDKDREGEGGENEEQDGPDKAFAWRMLAWKDENGKIPKDGKYKALQQREANVAYWKSNGTVRPFTDVWSSVGPTNVSGRVMGMAIDPRNPSIMFVASAGGGLWRTTNGGTNWTPVDDLWKSLAMGTVEMAPSNPDIIYAGTGEGAFNGDAIDGVGIYKSLNGGSTWTLLPNTTTFTTTNSIAVHPTSPAIVLAGTRYGGIQRSVDGGATWTNVKSAQGCFDIHFSKSNGNNLVADLLDYNGAVGWHHQAVYSTDAGATWQDATGITANSFEARITLAIAASNPLVVYAYVGNNQGEVYKSVDRGHTFSLVSNPGGNGQTWYTLPIWVDPTNSNVVVIGGLDCYRSTDGGVNWTQISEWTTGNPHADQHFLMSHPAYNGTSNKTFFVGSDGGVFKTDDIFTVTQNSGWVGLDNNQVSTQYYGAVGDGNTGKIIGGLQDNGTLYSSVGGTLATGMFGGDGGFCAMDPTDPNYAYGEYVYLRIHRTTTGGFGNFIFSGLSDAENGFANFIAPFILSPNNPNVLYGGGYDLWRSSNVKDPTPTWSSIRPGTPDGGNFDFIASIAEAPTDPNIVWVGLNSGRIQKTTNALAANPTWTWVDDNAGTNPLPNRYVGRILIDKANPNIVYAGFGGFNADNLWKSTDGGATWSILMGSGATALPSAPIRAIARHPGNASFLYVGTEVGVFSSADGGATWSASDYGPANVCTYELNFLNNSPNVLLAATHGRGLWTTIVGGGVGVASLTLSTPSVVGGNKVTGTIQLTKVAPTGGTLVTLTSSNVSAPVPATVTVPAGSDTGTFTITTNGVNAQAVASIKATVGGVGVSQNLTVTPAALTSLTLVPTTIEGGLGLNAVIRMNGAAGPAGTNVTITSNSPFATVPATVQIAANTTSKSFAMATLGVTATTVATISAQIGSGPIVSGNLTINPSTLQSISASPSPVVGGNYVAITLVVNGKTGPVGRTVTFTDSSGGVSGLQAAVKIPANTHAYTFTIRTQGVASQVAATLTGTTGAVSKSTTLTINPAKVVSLALSTPAVVGGNPVTGVVHLDGAPPASGSGMVVTLGDNSAFAVLPASVTVPVGTSLVSFAITTKGVDATSVATLTAAGGGGSANATLTINPAQCTIVVLTPSTVIGGVSTSALAKLNGAAGPSGVTLTLGSSIAAAHVPATANVPANGTGVTFTVTTDGVNANVTGAITGRRGAGSTGSGQLQITPGTMSSVTLTPSTVTGGATVSGVARIVGKAGPAGAVITLSTTNANAPVPATVTIPAGASAVSFSIKTKAVTSAQSATIKGTFNGTSAQAILTINP